MADFLFPLETTTSKQLLRLVRAREGEGEDWGTEIIPPPETEEGPILTPDPLFPVPEVEEVGPAPEMPGFLGELQEETRYTLALGKPQDPFVSGQTVLDVAMRPTDVWTESVLGVIGLQKALAEKAGISEGLIKAAYPFSSPVLGESLVSDTTPGEFFTRSYEEFRERPWWQQMALGFATEIGLPLAGATKIPGLSRGLGISSTLGPEKFLVRSADDAAKIIPPITNNIINLQPISVGLTPFERIRSIVASTLGKPFRATPLSDIATPAMRERGRVQAIIDVQGNILGARSKAAVAGVFDVDGNGRIPSLAGVDKTLIGTPTIQDVAARRPRFTEKLTGEQQRILDQLEREVSPFRGMLDELGAEVTKRTDILEGGFYLPRGREGLEGADEVLRVGAGRPRGKAGFEKPATFDSMAEGIEQGFKYAQLDETLQYYAKDAGSRALDIHIGNYFKVVVDESGGLVGQTPKMRLLQQNPGIEALHSTLVRNLARLSSLKGGLTKHQQDIIDSFLDDPEFDDINALALFLRDVSVRRGPSQGLNIAEVQEAITAARAAVAELAPAWKKALEQAKRPSPLRQEAFIDIAELNNRTFPVEVANAANAVIAADLKTSGKLAPVIDFLEAINNLYRGLNATLDDSAPGIQGLLGAIKNPKAWAQALRTHFLAFGKGGDEVLGKFLLDYDDRVLSAGRMPSIEWGKAGLRVGGQDTEYMLGRGSTSFLNKVPGIRQANRAFGYFGDMLRLRLADDELAGLLRKGRSLDELTASGDVERIARAVNGVTGWSRGKAFGNVGDLLLFAPRFLQARLDTVTRAAMGMRPGASIEQRYARSSILRLVGYGTLLTVAVNEMLGEETDLRPIVNGRYNPNFNRIRFEGRDWSLLGTYDSLARAIVTTAMGRPDEALRGMGSGVVSLAWDLLSNEDLTGEAVRDNPQQLGEYFLKQIAPFAVEETPSAVRKFSDKDVVGGVVAILGEGWGIKSTPLTGREATDVARKVEMEARGLTGDFSRDLGPGEQQEIDAVPSVMEAKDTWEKQQRDRQSKWRDYDDDRDEINDIYLKKVDGKYTGLIAEAAEQGPGLIFRKALAIHQRDRARDQASLKKRSSEALEWISEKEPSRAIESIALDAYMRAVQDPSLENPATLQYNFSERERLLRELREDPPDGFGDEVIDGVEAFIHRNEHPLAKQLREDREILKGYWEESVEQVKREFLAPHQAVIWEEYRGIVETVERRDFLERNRPVIRFAEKTLRAIRDVIQQEQTGLKDFPTVDSLLVKWGYDATPETEAGVATFERLLQERAKKEREERERLEGIGAR